MRKFYKLVLVLSILIISVPVWSQQNFFSTAKESDLQANAAKRVIRPQQYKATTMNVQGMRNFLWSLPSEKNLASRNGAPVLIIPMPDGSIAQFRVWESSIMAPELQAKFPEIKTFAGQGITDPYATIRFDYSPYYGFNAQVLTPNGAFYIDPYARGEINEYISYFKRDHISGDRFQCEVPESNTEMSRVEAFCRGNQLYTYRLAVACTGEYGRAATGLTNPTTAQVLSKIVTSVNRVDGVYETELAIRLELVANNDLIAFTNPATDPFTQNDNGPALLNESQTVIDGTIGFNFYDIGHTFSTGGGGIAQLGSVCGATKARGVTGRGNPVGDAYDIDYVAHEMGHQFGGSHTFNSTTGSCSGNRSSGQAYEVGSGTTIQAYAGICGSDNIQPNSDPFFHAISFDQISNFVEAGGASCRVVTPIVNTLPVITAMNNNLANIPLGTPFTLTGTATDADGDPLTYCWEEWDLGPSGAWNSGAGHPSAPLFKSRIPKTTGSRTFPDIQVILAGYPPNPTAAMNGLKGETLPTVGRDMNFRLTVRDNKGGVVSGGNGCSTGGFPAAFTIKTIATAGPFEVTSPNGGESYPGASTTTVTWNVANTNVAPISTTDVKISLSTDGGLTYPTVLLASTPNDGSQQVTLPTVLTNTARVKIEAINNVYFDISNANFTITAPISGFGFDNPATQSVACAGPTSVAFTLGTTSFSGYATPIDLSYSNNPAGTTVTISPTSVVPGSATTVTVNGLNNLSFGTYTVKITGVSGIHTQTRDLSFTIQPGTGPAITAAPQSTSACVGTNAVFSVTATSALSYQWQVSTDGGTNFTNVASAGNAATYTVTSVNTALNNNQYRVLVTGQCNVTTSVAATLTVQTAPAITTPPQSATLCLASNAVFNVVATGTNLTYQWQVSTDGGANYTNAPGVANGTSYTVAGITTAMNNNRYRVIVSGTCTPPATSAAAILTVISPVAITDQPDPITICETGTVSFTVAGSGANVIYQWQVSTNGGGVYTDLAEGGVYSGTKTATLTLTNVTSGLNNNLYRALLSNPTCTTPTASNGAVLTVNARPTVTLTAAPLQQLLPGQSTTITAAINPNASGFNITWFKNDVIIPGITVNTYLVDSVEVGDYKVKIINPTTGCNNESNVLTIGTTSSSRLFIFPSPNDGQFSVSYYNSGGGSTRQTIAVYSTSGAKVYYNSFAINGPYQILNVNIKGKAKGVYYVVIGDASGKKITEGKVLVY